jgi:hypothetical protein
MAARFCDVLEKQCFAIIDNGFLVDASIHMSRTRVSW